METINDCFPVQSLYFSCLNYLRINYKLINFTVLNDEIASDMAIIMKNHTHLKKYRMLPFREVKELDIIVSYLYKYYTSELVEANRTRYVNSLISNNQFIEYIPGIKTIGLIKWLIYDSDNDKLYKSTHDGHTYMYTFPVNKLRELFPDIEFYHDQKNISKLCSEEFFEKYPGLVEWLESIGRASRKLWISEDLIK